ncbi:MAG: trypsin-like peptidase domain-containing protein, partial [Lacipirellulaceae bacterium]
MPRRFLFACLALFLTLGSDASASRPLRSAIRATQQKVVKIYGAGGLRQLEAYQTGIVISPEGHVLTTLSYVLDTDDLAVVLDSGQKFQAEFVASDPVLELALLKLPAEEPLPAFDLTSTK